MASFPCPSIHRRSEFVVVNEYCWSRHKKQYFQRCIWHIRPPCGDFTIRLISMNLSDYIYLIIEHVSWHPGACCLCFFKLQNTRSDFISIDWIVVFWEHIFAMDEFWTGGWCIINANLTRHTIVIVSGSTLSPSKWECEWYPNKKLRLVNTHFRVRIHLQTVAILWRCFLATIS